MADLSKLIKIIKDYSKNSYIKLMRQPCGGLKYSFIVPGAGYDSQLWDWDSWLTSVAVRQIILDNGGVDSEKFLECEKGCVLNFLDRVDENGKMPIVIDSNGEPFFVAGTKNAHKPCLAQHLAFILKQTDNDISWVKDKICKLEKYIAWYEKTSKHTPTGLYYFLDDFAIGVDNDPSIFYRPDGATASIYLNSLMYKELLAMAQIMEILGDRKKVDYYSGLASDLKTAVNNHLYDEKCGNYFSADLNLVPIDKNKILHSGKPRHWDCLIMRIDSWAGFTALWAGIATQDRAKRVIEENMLNTNTFLSDYGVRSLSRLEKTYANWQSSNPSCWLGPIWGIVNYTCFRGMLNYGYVNEAKALATTMIKLFGEDVLNCGEMHEYYHGDTGEGISGKGFQSWNLLVNNMIAWYEKRPTVEEF